MSRYTGSSPMNRLQTEVDRLFDGLVGPQVQRWATGNLVKYPPVNVWEDGDAYHVEAELPGLTIEDIDLFVQDRDVTIAGKFKGEAAEGVSLHRHERPVGEFKRDLRLPLPLNAEAVEATLANGVLTLHLPKSESAKGRKVNIKNG